MPPIIPAYLCEHSFELDEQFFDLYNSAFPAEERESKAILDEVVNAGTTHYHRTLNEARELLCISITTPCRKFDFLAYIATNPAKRSSGVGSQHLQALLRQGRNAHMLLEIEATDPIGLVFSEKELELRRRRKEFYLRNGFRQLLEGHTYWMKSKSHPDSELYVQAELMVYGPALTRRQEVNMLRALFSEIYERQYDDPVVRKVMSQFDSSLIASIRVFAARVKRSIPSR